MSTPVDSRRRSISGLRERFVSHPLKQEQAERVELVRRCFHSLSDLIDRSVLEGCEKATAITKLEESMFWAVAGIAREK